MMPTNKDETERLIKKLIMEMRESDEVWRWAHEERKKAERKAAMWETVKSSTLGHLVWIVAVLMGTAIWEFVKRSSQK